MDMSLLKGMAKSVMKGLGASPEQFKAVDMLFESTWRKPRFACNSDIDELYFSAPETVVRADGVRNGKRIMILIHSEDPAIITPELRAWLKGVR